MKFRITRKEILASAPKERIISVPYCAAQSLLRLHTPVAYNAGMYGWNYDVYHVNGYVICTGYRGMPGRKVDSYPYEDQALELIRSDLPRYELDKRLDELVSAWTDSFKEEVIA